MWATTAKQAQNCCLSTLTICHISLLNLLSAKSSKEASSRSQYRTRSLNAYRHKVSVEDGVLSGTHCSFHLVFLIKSGNGADFRWNSTLSNANYCQTDLVNTTLQGGIRFLENTALNRLALVLYYGMAGMLSVRVLWLPQSKINFSLESEKTKHSSSDLSLDLASQSATKTNIY